MLIPGGGGARGYTPFGIETAKGASAHDLKEFWHVGRELPPGHRFRETMADNVWPEEVPSFKDTFLKLYDAFDEAGLKILAAIARHLGLDPDYFERDGRERQFGAAPAPLSAAGSQHRRPYPRRRA